mgnify:CR=1 FL=1
MAVVRVDNQFQILSPDTKLEAVRVTDIILDPSHDRFEDYGNYDSIGTIFYTTLNQSNPSTDSIAKPLFSFVKNYPLLNEVVLIMSSGDKDNKISTYYFPLVNIWNHPHHNALPYIEEFNNASSNDYEQSIARQVEDGSTGINLGNYFQEKLNIKPLLPYEGDTIIEGRFGNSIRFGSTNISNKVATPNEWSDSGELGDPITIIRNGQSSQLDDKGWVHAKEDIMGDASSIYMTSNQQLANFTPASLNQKSFGANLVEDLTIQQQLTGDYKTPETFTTQTEQTQEDIEETTESFDTTAPPPPPEESEPDDPFADYAEEILDGPGTIEIYGISGTDGAGEDNMENIGDGVVVTEEDIENLSAALATGTSISIPSKSHESSVTLHPPLGVYDLKTQIELQPTDNRVKYLVIHTAAWSYGGTHERLAKFFMQEAEVEGVATGWSRHGYHITIDYTGKCIQIYKDNERSFGVGTAGKAPNRSSNIGNHNTINLNWIGGSVFDLTKQQANSLNELVKFYVLRYPEIKILGHNQIYFSDTKGAKTCPWLDVPTYCRELGINENNIETANPAGYPLQDLKTNSINTVKLNLKSA